MTENIEQASSSADLLIWGIMFGLLVVVALGLAYWDIKSRKEKL